MPQFRIHLLFSVFVSGCHVTNLAHFSWNNSEHRHSPTS